MRPKLYADHYSIEVNKEFHKKKKQGNKPVMNYSNKAGWDNYSTGVPIKPHDKKF